MKLPLRAHQTYLFEQLWQKKFGMDASEPGTGKTATCLALIEKEKKQAYIIVPAYLVRNWISEIRKFTDLTCAAFSPKQSKYSEDIVVVSYHRLHQIEHNIPKGVFLAVDEAHYIANPQAKRSQILYHLVKHRSPCRLHLMSGTFLRNAVSELWMPMLLCDFGHNRGFRDNFRSHYGFKDTFMHRTEKRIYNRRIVTWEGARNTEYLKQWMDAYSVQVRLNQLTELPPLVSVPLLCAPPSPELDGPLLEAYEAYKGKIIGENSSIQTIKAKNALSKAPFTVEFATDLLQQGTKPLLIFTDHVASAHSICESLCGKYKVSLVTGEVAAKKRDIIVNQFQAGHIEVLVATIGSMSLGVTLTRASVVIFNDKNFDPSQNRQATGRVLRISQEAEKVLCYTILREGVDERINQLLEEKMEIIGKVVQEYEGADLEW